MTNGFEFDVADTQGARSVLKHFDAPCDCGRESCDSVARAIEWLNAAYRYLDSKGDGAIYTAEQLYQALLLGPCITASAHDAYGRLGALKLLWKEGQILITEENICVAAERFPPPKPRLSGVIVMLL